MSRFIAAIAVTAAIILTAQVRLAATPAPALSQARSLRMSPPPWRRG